MPTITASGQEKEVLEVCEHRRPGNSQSPPAEDGYVRDCPRTRFVTDNGESGLNRGRSVMRSNAPMPEDSWPHDMSLTVDDQPLPLLELLWVREAHDLRPRGAGLPPLLLDPPSVLPPSAISVGERAKWTAAWPLVWRAAVKHAGEDRDSLTTDEELKATTDGSSQRADVLRRTIGPRWSDSFGGGAQGMPAYSAWLRRMESAEWAAAWRRDQSNPERRDLVALIPAWRAGLTKIVLIPCSGEFIQRIGDNTLLVTAATRQNSESYRHALNTFT